MKFKFKKPNLPKLNLPKFNLSFLKSDWGIIGVGVLICVLVAYFLIKMLSEKDAAMLEYRRILEEYEKLQEEGLQNQELSTEQSILTIQGVDGTPKGSLTYILADTDELRASGLSEYQSLDAGSAMVFSFEAPVAGGFTMEGMNFPLDLILLDSNYTVIDIATNLQPCTEACTPYFPTVDYQYAVEANAGTVETLGIVLGDTITN